MLSQNEVLELLGPVLSRRGKPYIKVKRVFLRPAIAGEKIETILDGKVETKNVAKEGDMIARADTSFKEQYILKSEDFHKNLGCC